MATPTTVSPVQREYALPEAPQEYERLHAQARMWDPELERGLDAVRLSPGARCLDAGCGPGGGMRVLARRVGPDGVVVGADVDARAGSYAVETLHAEGHSSCRFVEHDLTRDEPVPEAPYDLVLARLLLFHLPSRAAVLRRLWDAVAPGGSLLVQDYDVRVAGKAGPALASLEEVRRVVVETFVAVGADPFIGTGLPLLFAEAEVGPPDGTEVGGRLVPLAGSRAWLEQTTRSLLPVAVARGVTTEADAERTLRDFGHDAASCPQDPFLWPLMVSAWKRKP